MKRQINTQVKISHSTTFFTARQRDTGLPFKKDFVSNCRCGFNVVFKQYCHKKQFLKYSCLYSAGKYYYFYGIEYFGKND